MERVQLLVDIIDSLKQEKNYCLKGKIWDRLSGPNGVNARLKLASMRLEFAKRDAAKAA